MKVRSGCILKAHYEHDCGHCVLVGHRTGTRDKIEDVYLCVPKDGGMGSIVHRKSADPSDYSSFSLAFEGEPDPTRERLAFSTIRRIERTLNMAGAMARVYEEANRVEADDDEEDRARKDRLVSAFETIFAEMWFYDPTEELVEEEIRRVDWHFDTHIGERWPVIYTPHESTPAPE